MSTQWWARGIANTAPVRLPPPFTVAPGDQVLSVLTASDPQNVVFVMVRITAFVPAHARATGRSDAERAVYPDVRSPRRTAFISMPQRKSDTEVGINYGGFPD
jgi:hypothetical protein